MNSDHLGGHNNKTHIDAGTLDYLQTQFKIKTMLDIGCGLGDMFHVAQSRNIDWAGIDGDVITRQADIASNVIMHDFTLSACSNLRKYDLAWSVEFLEHVDEKYVPNFMPAFAQCKYAIVTAAPPGAAGHHHVNCRTEDYWKGVFAAEGFEYLDDITQDVRRYSSMTKYFMRRSGMFFRKYD